MTQGGDEGQWWPREMMTKGSGEEGKWWRREVVRKGSGDEVVTLVLGSKPEHETLCFSV